MAGDAPDVGKVKADPTLRVAVIRSVWHSECTEVLRNECVKALVAAGIPEKNILVIDAPGSFELPLLAKHVIEQRNVDGVIVLGVVVQGVTHHARLVAEQAAAGCMQVQLGTGIPVTFEVLYVDTIDDAISRSIGKNGKGSIAAATLLSCLAGIRKMSS